MSAKSKVQPGALASVETARTESYQPLVRLSIMMFVEFAVWGAWSVLLGKHMEHLGFSGKQIGLVYLTTALGAMLSPLVAGWIADRFMPNQIFTGIVHLLGAVLLFIAWPQTQFGGMFVALLIYAILYMPTIALTNAIAFHHMKDSKKFGNIRVWGTIGWIVVNWIISGYLLIWGRYQPGAWRVGDCLLFAAVLSAFMGIYCFTLPNTPPAKQAKNPYAFVEAFRLMSNRNFAVLLVISFVVAIELPFYYSYTIIFLTDTNAGVGLSPGWANAAMSIGQVAEIALMLLLAPSLRNLGMRMTIVLGILAWPLRYAIFAIGQPWYLVVAAQALHGICYSFFFAGGMIAVERLSPKDIRASAQGLLLFATNGVGMLIGNLISGPLYDVFVAARVSHAWPKFFLVPIVVTILGAIVFAVLFKERQFQTDAAEIEQREAVAV
ncbi:MAG TPA: MFS transporter [Phycisphaerae bacterium]|jgi:nucleoside transporter|nr:MFS transporter [Phycisphaerae bacterium]HPC22643.1 MFS transporter [Phycisphaerae bacterium]